MLLLKPIEIHYFLLLVVGNSTIRCETEKNVYFASHLGDVTVESIDGGEGCSISGSSDNKNLSYGCGSVVG